MGHLADTADWAAGRCRVTAPAPAPARSSCSLIQRIKKAEQGTHTACYIMQEKEGDGEGEKVRGKKDKVTRYTR